MVRKYNYTCHNGDTCWKATISDISSDCESKYITCTFTARGSRLATCIGETDGYKWIVFPEIDKGASLAELSDQFWNIEKLSYVLNSEADATTVASGLHFINTHLL